MIVSQVLGGKEQCMRLDVPTPCMLNWQMLHVSIGDM